MANFLTAQQKAKKLTPQKIEKDLFRFIKSIEKEIFDLNVRQLEQAENAEGGALVNSNSRFSGVYQSLTVDIAATENPILPKKEGSLYNFGWTGDFLGNFKMDLFNDKVELFSTGTGSGEKAAFFDGYQSLYGLSPKSIVEIINRRIRPFFITYFPKNLI
jgi:hypothetical protein